MCPPDLDSLIPSAHTAPPSSQHAFNAKIKVQWETPYISPYPSCFQSVKCLCESFYLAVQTRDICSAFELHSWSWERKQTVNNFNTGLKCYLCWTAETVLCVFIDLIQIKEDCPIYFDFTVKNEHFNKYITKYHFIYIVMHIFLAAEVKEAAGEPHLWAQISWQNPERRDFGEPWTTHR